MSSLRRFYAVSGLVLCLAVPAIAANPVGWRTDGSGRYPDAKPPVEWSKEKNVVWRTELPGRSHCGPVLVKGRIFITAEPNIMLCLDEKSGKILWQHSATLADVFGKEKAAQIEADVKKAKELESQRRELRKQIGNLRKDNTVPKEKIDALQKKERELRETIQELTKFSGPQRGANGNATATPVTDGTNVYAVFGNGVVRSYTLDGRKNWFRFVQAPKIGFGHSSSPVIADGKLIVHYSDLFGLNLTTGETEWQSKVPAKHGSPVVARAGNDDVIVTPGGTIVRAADGKILAEKLFQIGHASPIVHEGVIFAIANGKVLAVDLPKSADEKAEWKVRWEGRGMRQRSFASPVYANGLLYGVTEKGILDVLDASNGKLVLRKRLEIGGRVYPSPTLAGAHLYLSSNDGTTLVLQPGKQYKELARNQLEQFSGAPVFSGNRMFVRARKYMYCIGK